MESKFYILNSLAMTHRDILSGLKEIGGLSISGYRVLLRVSESESGLRVTEIATDLDMKFAAVASVVNVLVEKGHVLRNEDPKDKRASRLLVSEKGAELLAHIDEMLLDHLKKRWKPLNKKHLDAMLVDLDKAHLTSEYVASVELPYATAEDVLKKWNISYTQCLIMFLLILHHTLRPIDIAYRLEQKPTTISVAMNSLKDRGYITRKPSRKARSMVDISITSKGRGLLLEAVDAVFVAILNLESYNRSGENERMIFELTRLIGDTGSIEQSMEEQQMQ